MVSKVDKRIYSTLKNFCCFNMECTGTVDVIQQPKHFLWGKLRATLSTRTVTKLMFGSLNVVLRSCRSKLKIEIGQVVFLFHLLFFCVTLISSCFALEIKFRHLPNSM